MTIEQIYLFNGLYLIVLVLVVVLTRAKARRVAGALAGGVVAGSMVMGIIALGERLEWWNIPIVWEPYFLTMFGLGIVLVAFVFLITWRIARRFGWRGLAVCVIIAAIIGPPRDYWYMSRFPEWGTFAPGIAPVIAISVTYALLIVVGHGVMWLVAGPANQDDLSKRLWKKT